MHTTEIQEDATGQSGTFISQHGRTTLPNTDRTDAPLRLLNITEIEQASGGNPLLAAAFAFGLVTGYVGGGEAITKSIDVNSLLSQK